MERHNVPFYDEYFLEMLNFQAKSFIVQFSVAKLNVTLKSILCFSLLLTNSGKKIPRVSGSTAPNVAQTRTSAHPEDHPGQPDALHRGQVQEMPTHTHTHTVLCIQ